LSAGAQAERTHQQGFGRGSLNQTAPTLVSSGLSVGHRLLRAQVKLAELRREFDQLDAKIHGVMAFTLWFGVLAFTVLYVYLLDRRYRLLALDEEREEREVQYAIAERVQGASPRTDPSMQVGVPQ